MGFVLSKIGQPTARETGGGRAISEQPKLKKTCNFLDGITKARSNQSSWIISLRAEWLTLKDRVVSDGDLWYSIGYNMLQVETLKKPFYNPFKFIFEKVI